MSKPIIAYWDIRGLAEPIRTLFEYLGVDYEDKRYLCTADGDRSSWTDVKFTLGLNYPNLPYIIDGDVRITQSNALLRYVGRKYGKDKHVCGSTEVEEALADSFLCHAMDLRNSLVRLCYGPKDNFDTNKATYLSTTLPAFYEAMEGTLKARGTSFFAGDQPTLPDFHYFELMDQINEMDATAMDSYPLLKAYYHRFAALPSIAAYRASDRFKAHPINNPSASFK
eukprot:TRINITY_DN3121_c0_g1_i4.p2 TRINITY_DN3121_c0_g1~~TRINITY_DN3121_c0_g1_i4.p2  ORF type:complete len:234 (-),score=76.25 TRINITY_DN3121_c0_g1_i4:525-1199(-)